MSEGPRPTELSAIEEGLRRLQPAPAGLDRDQLMYRAGQESIRRAGWGWPTAAAAAVLLAVGLGGALALRPPPTDRVVYVERQAPAPVKPDEGPGTADPPAPVQDRTAYLRLREQVLEHGVDSLPPPPTVPPLPKDDPLF